MRTLLALAMAASLCAQTPAGKGKATTKAPAKAATKAPAAATPKTVKEVMTAMTIPASDAVMNIPLKDKVEAKDWTEMRRQTAILIESANLLMKPPLAKDNGDWMKASKQMADVAKKAQAAITAKDLDKLSVDISDQLLMSCSGCHDKYMK